jgi:hypothetical protein
MAGFTLLLPVTVDGCAVAADNFGTVTKMRRGRLAQSAVLIVLLFSSLGVAAASPLLLPGSRRAARAIAALIQPALVRAEIVTLDTRVHDYSVDRGIVSRLHGWSLTLREADGRMVTVKLSRMTDVRLAGRRIVLGRVQKGMVATAIADGNSPVSKLFVARKSLDGSNPTVKALLSTGFVRAEVVSQLYGRLTDTQADTGVIESFDGAQMTLVESDGLTTVPIPVSDTAEIQVDGRVSDTTALSAGMRVTIIQYDDGSPTQIWAVGKASVGKIKHVGGD